MFLSFQLPQPEVMLTCLGNSNIISITDPDAKILYEENCVEDGLVKANGTKIAFMIVPQPGKKVTTVKYFTAKSEDKFADDGSNTECGCDRHIFYRYISGQVFGCCTFNTLTYKNCGIRYDTACAHIF